MTSIRLDPRMPPVEDCVVRHLLDRHARDIPDQVAVLFEDDISWTYKELRVQVLRFGTGLQKLGVRQGDFVACCLPNGPHLLTLWYALNYIGAVFVPINIAYRGKLLEHVLNASGARLLIVDAQLVDRVVGLAIEDVTDVVVIGECGIQVPGKRMRREEELQAQDAELQPLERDIAPWDNMAVIFTSGTTGPSKGAVSSYLHYHAGAMAFAWVTNRDRNLISLPLFHSGGAQPTYRMLCHGGSIALVSQFSTHTFWQTVRRTQATTLQLLGAMASFLVKHESDGADHTHTLRTACIVPFNEDALEFGRRFGIECYGIFGMTETASCMRTGANPRQVGSCGSPRPGLEARLVDANDCEVPLGTVGELIVRPDMPWGIAHQYLNNPAGTATAWRNGWFHTGDGFRKDEDGNFFYVDRLKDSMRRRGENISSIELEQEISAFPGINEVAAVAVPSEHGEDEIMAVIAPREGHVVDPRALVEFLQARVAHFMIPRFVRFVDHLPKTPTHKVVKYELRAQGLTQDTWDREKAGVRIKRTALKARAIVHKGD